MDCERPACAKGSGDSNLAFRTELTCFLRLHNHTNLPRRRGEQELRPIRHVNQHFAPLLRRPKWNGTPCSATNVHRQNISVRRPTMPWGRVWSGQAGRASESKDRLENQGKNNLCPLCRFPSKQTTWTRHTVQAASGDKQMQYDAQAWTRCQCFPCLGTSKPTGETHFHKPPPGERGLC